MVDVQNDFCPGGALPVPHGDRVVPVLNRVIREAEHLGLPVYASRDWHPADSTHFRVAGGHWPVHCVAGSRGAEFVGQLQLPSATHILDKGVDQNADGYSALEGRLHDGTLFEEHLHTGGIDRLVVGGLATDYCVRHSVLDARGRGLRVTVLTDAVAAVDLAPGDGDRALAEMQAAGATLSRSATTELLV
ncbi:MAG: isochorismatase family protein [Acidobacteriota bacterium]|nr:isochorismatase family protein [Acidobacteriota bacterium]